MASLGTWSKRFKWTADNTNVDSNLTNFIVKFHISTSAGIGGVDVSKIFDELASDANRRKIAVTTSDGVSQCYVIIEHWDHASEKAVLAVYAPGIAAGSTTDFYLYFDKSQPNNSTYVDDATLPGAAKNVVKQGAVSAMWNFNNTSLYNISFYSAIEISDETAPSHTGSGLDDLNAGGALGGYYSGDLLAQGYRVEIDGIGTPDTFKWSDNGGSTWNATYVSITGGSQTLNNSVRIDFDATTGHTFEDYWDFTAYYNVVTIDSGAAEAGKSGLALPFDGVDQEGEVNGANVLRFPNPGSVYTIRAVFKADGDGPLLGRYRESPNQIVDFQLSVVGGFLEFERCDGGAAFEGFADSSTSVDDDAYHSLVFVNHAEDDHRLWIDGVLQVSNTGTWTQTVSGAIGSLWFARRYTSYYACVIDDVEINPTNVADEIAKAWHHSMFDTLGTWSEFMMFASLTEAVVLDDTLDDMYFSEVLTEGVVLDDTIAVLAELVASLTEAVVLDDTWDVDTEYGASFTGAVALDDEIEGLNWTRWLAENEKFAVNHYYLILTDNPE